MLLAQWALCYLTIGCSDIIVSWAAALPGPALLQAVAAKISAARALAQRLAEEKSAVAVATRASADGSLDEEELTQCDFEAVRSHDDLMQH